MSKTYDLDEIIELNAQMYAYYVYRQIVLDFMKDALNEAKVTWLDLDEFEKMYWDAINAFYNKESHEWSYTTEKLQNYNFVRKICMENVGINLTINDITKIHRRHITDDILKDIQCIIDNVKKNTI